MTQNKTINWYPGHMAKARREMEEQLKLVDIIIEIRDARIPYSSRNPLLEEMAGNKPRLIILNKADMSDPEQNKLWEKAFSIEHSCLCTDSLNGRISSQVVDRIKLILKDKLDKAKARGIRKKVLRAMVVGIPNVGKSTFINNIVHKKVAKAENHPGVTRNLQWIRIHDDVELLDTPGVLWPKLSDQEVAYRLALLGSINDEILDRKELIEKALVYLVKEYPGVLGRSYGISENDEDLLEQIALKRQWLLKEGKADLHKACIMILKDIRNNRLGAISWEKYDDVE